MPDSIVLDVLGRPIGLTIFLIVVLSVIVVQTTHYRRRRLSSLPPGPPSSFWRGSYIPSKHPWRKMKEYTDRYGDLITLHMPNGKLLFVCGRASSADAILNKNSAVTSDRPHLIMAGDLISGGKRTLILGHNDRWRKYRKIMHEALNNSVAVRYEPIQETEAIITASSIGQDPDNFQRHFIRYAASTIMTVAYDYPVRSLDEPLVQSVNECLGNLGRWISPSASPLDMYPLLRYLPIFANPWKQIGQRMHKQELALFLNVYQDVRKRAKEGKAQACFSTQLQEKQKEYGLSDEEACYVAGSLFGAGSDTTASALSIFVMAMITHPGVMKKAQVELDFVVGADRLPSFTDFSDLPYIRALCQEVSRWRPVSSGGFQHALTEDVNYQNYILPKGSAVVGNHWSIHLDPEEYPEPDVFKPERFLADDGKTVKGTWFSPKGHIQFGFGRRVCVGSNVAERSIFINCALLLWAFNFEAPTGRVEDVDTLAFNSAANSHPLPFNANISYRSPRHRQIVEQHAADVSERH